MVTVGCGAANCGDTNYVFCKYAKENAELSKPWVNGSSCTDCGSDNCSDNLCSCNKLCFNYGTLDKKTCTCKCPPYATGDTCEKLVCDKSDLGKIYYFKKNYILYYKYFKLVYPQNMVVIYLGYLHYAIS